MARPLNNLADPTADEGHTLIEPVETWRLRLAAQRLLVIGNNRVELFGTGRITSDGDLTADLLQGGSVELKTSDGDIDAEKIEAEMIKARSSDGDVNLTVSGSELVARTSDGDLTVVISGQIALDLSTGDGDVTVRAPKGFGAVLDLKGEKVKLGGKVALDGEVSSRRVSGTLGDGGPTVRVRTGDGSIVLRFD